MTARGLEGRVRRTAPVAKGGARRSFARRPPARLEAGRAYCDRERWLERLHVRRIRALGPGLGVVADLRALRERLEAAPGDGAVVHEQVLALIVGRDEPEALLVAEPLHGSGCHLFPPGGRVLRNAGGARQQLRTLALLHRQPPARHTSVAPRRCPPRPHARTGGGPRQGRPGVWVAPRAETPP